MTGGNAGNAGEVNSAYGFILVIGMQVNVQCALLPSFS